RKRLGSVSAPSRTCFAGASKPPVAASVCIDSPNRMKPVLSRRIIAERSKGREAHDTRRAATRRSAMTSRAATEYRYEKLTWPEIKDAIELGKVCIVPCGAVEQHGPHLPLDVDIICPTEIARGAGKLVPDKMLVLPTVCYGYTGHVMDFPGTINNDFAHFIHHVLDTTKSLAYPRPNNTLPPTAPPP